MILFRCRWLSSYKTYLVKTTPIPSCIDVRGHMYLEHFSGASKPYVKWNENDCGLAASVSVKAKAAEAG